MVPGHQLTEPLACSATHIDISGIVWLGQASLSVRTACGNGCKATSPDFKKSTSVPGLSKFKGYLGYLGYLLWMRSKRALCLKQGPCAKPTQALFRAPLLQLEQWTGW